MSDMALAESRKARCVELRLAGHDYDYIAECVGYSSRATAWHAVQKALGERLDDAVDEYRRLELDRLDALQSACWDKAMTGDIASVNAVLKVMGQRSRLLALDQLAVQATQENPKTVVIQGSTEQFIQGLKGVDQLAEA